MKKEKYESAIADYQKALELDHGNRGLIKFCNQFFFFFLLPSPSTY